jgi:phenylacetate-coenzyme A ligase PaaK-like adenylate-forming protein
MSRVLAKANWVNRAYIGLVNPVLNGKTYRGMGRRMRELQRLERMSLEENRNSQWQAISRLLQHAYDSTPFYRQRLESVRAKPAEFQSFDDLQKIPALTRDDIRRNLEGLWSRRYPKELLKIAATGGTTDTPVPLLRSPECLTEKLAVQFHFNTWAGMWPGDKVFRFWGAQQDYSPNPSWRWRFYLRHLMRTVIAPTSLLSPAILESYRHLLNDFQPKVIYAYPTPLTLFCEYLSESKRPYHHPRSAICTAEPLLPHQRQIIEQTLRCEVFEHYGTRDFGMVGAECEAHQGMHLNPSAVFVEFVPIEGAEEDGLHEILVTDLLNYGMPLIRYRINDCAIPASARCECGRGFPLIKKIVGRTTDNFYLANGNVVPGVALTNRVIQVCPGLKKVQVIQNTLSDFHIRYVPGPDFSTSDLALLGSKLRVFFPDPLQWTFEEVAEIERERSGKTRFCISHVKKNETSSVPETRT